MRLSQIFGDTLIERVTTGTVIATPVWLPPLDSVSERCATIAPILGVAWVCFQILKSIRDEIREMRRRN